MKKFISSLPYTLGTALGTYAMYISVTGRLHTNAASEIAVFSLGFLMATFSAYAAGATLTDKNI